MANPRDVTLLFLARGEVTLTITAGETELDRTRIATDIADHLSAAAGDPVTVEVLGGGRYRFTNDAERDTEATLSREG